jgi:tRNA(fMet)-specific endonuclease VapC
MLDTNICSYIIRNHPREVITKLQSIVQNRHRIVVSAITYSELKYGAIGKKSSPKHVEIVTDFMQRVDAVIPWDRSSVDEATKIKKYLSDKGQLIGNNDIAIAGNAIARSCVLVTNNTDEFIRVPHLMLENWVNN